MNSKMSRPVWCMILSRTEGSKNTEQLRCSGSRSATSNNNTSNESHNTTTIHSALRLYIPFGMMMLLLMIMMMNPVAMTM